MVADFKKPFAAPPVIFGVAFLVGLLIGVIDPRPQLPMWLQLLAGAPAVASGVLLIRSSMRSIDRADTTYDPYAASSALVTSGIYRYTRNPGYLGLAIIHVGLALVFDSPWIAVTAIAGITITSLFVIKLEEDKLTRTFGQEYLDYISQVRRWM